MRACFFFACCFSYLCDSSGKDLCGGVEVTLAFGNGGEKLVRVVIVISALEYDDIVLQAFKLGATDFITKPFKPYELILRIRKIFQELEV